MMKLNKSILIAAALAAGVCAPLTAARVKQVESEALKLYDMNVDVNENAGTVKVRVELDLDRFHVSNEREMIFTPMLIAADKSDSIALRPVIVAGRARWYHYLRDGLVHEGSDIYRSGTKGYARYEADYKLLPWMAHSTLEMRAQTANCCDAPQNLVGESPNGYIPMAEINLGSNAFDVPFVFAPPVDAGPVKKAIEGSAFVTFVVNRTELKPDYMKNPVELRKIINSIEQVRNDPEAEISSVHIKGFASPEGPWNNNVRLATGRTETLRRYVRDLYKFPDSTVTSSFEPEDWAGLRNYVKDSLDYPIAHRAEILRLIDSDMEPDAKDAALKSRFPQDYSVILKEIYPWLRHSDYSVKYTIKIFTSLEDIKRVYATDPTRLRNVDFFTLAQSYPEGSKDYCDVMMKAVEIYPDDKLLNLNAANVELERGDLDRAQEYLLKAGTGPEAEYARGVLAARHRNYAEAIRRFEAAAKGGVKPAAEAARLAAELRDANPVTYIHPTTVSMELQKKK